MTPDITRPAGPGDFGPAEAGLLVRRVREGDRQAFLDLTRAYQKKVFALAYSRLPDLQGWLFLYSDSHP